MNMTKLIIVALVSYRLQKIQLDKLYTQRKLYFAYGFKYKSSRPDVFCKRGVLRNFTKFTGKHLCQGLYFNKSAGLKLAGLLGFTKNTVEKGALG